MPSRRIPGAQLIAPVDNRRESSDRGSQRAGASAAAAWHLAVREVRVHERVVGHDPVRERLVERRVVALPVGLGGHPPAHVDVVAQQVLGERHPPAHRVQVTAAEVPPVVAAHDVRVRVALAELELVPDQVGVVVVGVDRAGRPPAAAGAGDQVDAGVDAADVVVEVYPAQHRRPDVLVRQVAGRHEPGRQGEALDQAREVHRCAADRVPSPGAPRGRGRRAWPC